MFPARFSPRFSRLARAVDVALEFATLGELRLDEPADVWEEPAAGLPEASAAAAELSPVLPPPFPPATAAGRRALEAQRAAERAAQPPECAGTRQRGSEPAAEPCGGASACRGRQGAGAAVPLAGRLIEPHAASRQRLSSSLNHSTGSERLPSVEPSSSTKSRNSLGS